MIKKSWCHKHIVHLSVRHRLQHKCQSVSLIRWYLCAYLIPKRVSARAILLMSACMEIFIGLNRSLALHTPVSSLQGVCENLYVVNIGLHRKIYAPNFQRLSQFGICIYYQQNAVRKAHNTSECTIHPTIILVSQFAASCNDHAVYGYDPKQKQINLFSMLVNAVKE
jgi:hypothetical protein